jgi:hypothetical protein
MIRMGGAIRVAKGKYVFHKGSLRMHVDDSTLFGDGYTKIVHLHQPYILTNESVSTSSKRRRNLGE